MTFGHPNKKKKKKSPPKKTQRKIKDQIQCLCFEQST